MTGLAWVLGLIWAGLGFMAWVAVTAALEAWRDARRVRTETRARLAELGGWEQ